MDLAMKSELRVMIGRRVQDWTGMYDSANIMVRFCGCKDYRDMAFLHDDGNAEVTRKLEMLAGPYGEVIFKAWKVLGDGRA